MNRAALFAIGLTLPLCGAVLGAPPTAEVRFTVDAGRDVKPISRFIYGINDVNIRLKDNYPAPTIVRLGGNRFTAFNWTNNASNAGADYHFESDGWLGGGITPGGAVIRVIDGARQAHAACILTVPINGYVAEDKNTADVTKAGPDYLQRLFRPEAATKNGPFTLSPDPNAPVIYEDEFINWVKANYPERLGSATVPIFFSLDNEPGLWPKTHPEVHPKQTTYAELIAKSIDYASAIKRVAPTALVFGHVGYGWKDFVSLENAPDANGRDFEETFLAAMADAEKQSGRRLVDVLDTHWYPEATGGGIRIINNSKETPDVAAARVQAPRSLWDPDYVETSWLARDAAKGPIRLFPRIWKKIADNYPGTKLSMTEYNFGGTHDISGAIAVADVLGIFGREGLFAANEWPFDVTNGEPFVVGAFRIYRDFDNKQSTFGDTSVMAKTDDVASTSIYASTDTAKPGTMTLVAINKTEHPISAEITVTNAAHFTHTRSYLLSGTDPEPHSAGEVPMADPGHLQYVLPPMSVTMLWLAGS